MSSITDNPLILCRDVELVGFVKQTLVLSGREATTAWKNQLEHLNSLASFVSKSCNLSQETVPFEGKLNMHRHIINMVRM